MNGEQALAVLGGVLVGGALAGWVIRRRIDRAPRILMRTNVTGERVPAVLGEAVLVGSAGVVACIVAGGLAGWDVLGGVRPPAALATAVIVMAAAGRWDDLRGDERPRGFGGHIGALRGGRITGGLVKIAAGGVAGIACGLILSGDLWIVLEAVLLVALSANLLNLLDRAPGRAAKLWLVLAVPLFVFGEPVWAIAASGMLGAVFCLLPSDLGERAMLGDMGANPLGAVVGLGLLVSLDRPFRVAAILVLLALNLASERYSFSTIIERNALLRKLDRIGRK